VINVKITDNKPANRAEQASDSPARRVPRPWYFDPQQDSTAAYGPGQATSAQSASGSAKREAMPNFRYDA
jgi:hypothetical protein